jgi:hypothetical protein
MEIDTFKHFRTSFKHFAFFGKPLSLIPLDQPK